MIVCDVSGSMFNFDKKLAPIDISISLGILISQCVDDPFKNKVISFHETPSIVDI
jgi:hypothetical protein